MVLNDKMNSKIFYCILIFKKYFFLNEKRKKKKTNYLPIWSSNMAIMSSTPLTIYVKVEPSFLFLGEVIAGGASPLAAAAAAF